jgi:hypothetical protein
VGAALLWASAASAVIAFSVAFLASGLIGVARQAAAAARDSLRALSDPSLDDAAKESHARAASLKLFGAFAGIALRSALVLLAPVAALWVFDALGLVPLDAAFDFLLRWDVLLLATLLGVGVWFVLRKRS